ncbi:hypothetical protein [Bacillus sp. 1NLA3E]|uniref:hypothetical protein n=1 Tax=Bacillus sp. 1NLA3E TaxID=666686 RepID=UPI000247ECBF|nr:hypothetical protein [Bacillus sp. 1NLA3E]AGK52309.1 hypothetical protein B1NLA3E_02645 [Bacillus sp. 1NLA3E]
MWADDDELEYKVKRTKFLSGAGCLIVGFILLVLIVVFTVSFSIKVYDKLTEDREMVVSKSPDQNQTIKVKVKGTLTFDDPTVVISYENYKIQRKVSNDRKSLNPSDISISWKNNEEATILLFGEKQAPEVIEFKVPNRGIKSNPFQVVQRELGFIPFEKSESPKHFNIVELRRNTYSKGMSSDYDKVPIEVYCGEVGSDLQKYGEFSGSDKYQMDFFLFTWDDEQHVTITARENNKNEAVDTMKIELK